MATLSTAAQHVFSGASKIVSLFIHTASGTAIHIAAITTTAHARTTILQTHTALTEERRTGMTNNTIAIVAANQSNVTLLSPGRFPTVADQPIICVCLRSITNNCHCMICLFVATTISQDATVV
jgi:hypothetical protein